MKKAALIFVSLMTSVGLGAVLFFSDQQSPSAPVAQSQADVEVDTTSTKHFFDFSLSSLGEQNLDEIKQRISQHTSSDIDLNDDEELFEAYLQYKQALTELEPLQTTQLSAVDLEQLHLRILDLQFEYFSEQQIEQLFAEENQLRQLAIEKMKIAQNDLASEQKQALLNDQLVDMPEYVQQAEKNNQLVVNLTTLSTLDGQQKHLAAVELVGEAGAERLKALDQQRASFQDKIDSYLQHRDELLTSDFLSEQDKLMQITQLREESFDPTQLRRVEALERIHDQSR
ncbi:lipase secretion chaperone [Vibrio ouci]|uniref:Lipase chaperone n=1 Tax=Vibrio ouci TaxID=2499078 RepID=A0A4Y8WIL5_9VIBR|nr:lipase secretion chaperone [Vibrio ouci]TFH92767.1 lipase chaperone [Vibrio ouci]